VNYALEQGYDYLFTINDDSVVEDGHISRLVTIAQTHHLCILGNRIDYLESKEKIWALGTELTWGTPNFLSLNFHNYLAQELPSQLKEKDFLEVDTLPGNGVLIHRDIFINIGLYRAQFLPHYHADSELFLRANKHGFRSYVSPNIILKNDFSKEQKKLSFKGLKNLLYTFFNPKSHLFMPAIFYIFICYCPWSAYPKTAYYLLARLISLRKRSLGSERC
ncbi:MAG: glycosyltransferase, partial [Leptolyngbya sp. SIO1D8]|nr:glycosyltransferase [Leptolyngbya sp. SIO1D8]